ncbi:MAG: bifunctional serine/threonine-protein kinase/formylglycine-generating enzyme family protein [Thermodesulfobacteriota bacterium]
MMKGYNRNKLQLVPEIGTPSMMNPPANSILKTGFILNEKWVVIELIGKGAMGEVYRAHQLNLKRDVAIKVISQELLQSFEEDTVEIENACQRFRREVQAMARIRHPNVLQIYDYGSETVTKDGKSFTVEYIVMEFIPGATLRYTMSEEGFYPEENLAKEWLEEYFLPLLNGVEAIHDHDIIHRDLKPENVLLDGNIPKIADFGIARSSWLKPVTQSVDVKGTPAYMSPEHFFDFKKADQQSDIYSLGKILFEAVSGKITRETMPFKSVRLPHAETPFFQKLDRIIQDATAEEKGRRPQTIGEFNTLIQEALQILSQTTSSQSFQKPGRFSFLTRPGFIWAGIIIAVVSVLSMVLWHLTGKKDSVLTAVQKTPPAIEDTFQSSSGTTQAPVPTIRGKDGILMRLVPGGRVTVTSKDLERPEHSTVEVPPFYMDETKVTNHHFIEFLNAVKETLTISDGIVRQQDRILLYLGSGSEPTEQILYEQNRFLLRKAEFAAYPVVRVTWHGAHAYADYYGKRLLTEFEWDYAAANNLFVDEAPVSNADAPVSLEGHPHMAIPAPGGENTRLRPSDQKKVVDETLPQKPVVDSGVQIYSKNIPREWVILTEAVMVRKGEIIDSKPHKSLIANKLLGTGKESKSYRYPWEAFVDVGFRCASSVNAVK